MAPKGPVIKGSKNVEIRPLRAFSGSPSENSTHKGHRDIGVADQIETTTEPGASRKALPERMNQQRPGNAKRWFAGACALCALPKTHRSLPEPLVRRQAPFGQRRFPASPGSLEESIGRRVGFP